MSKEGDLKRMSEEFLAGEDGKKLSGKRSEIEHLASSRDGEKVRSMLEAGGFEDAVRRGDTKALRASLEQVMNTESGSRLVKSLRELMSKK